MLAGIGLLTCVPGCSDDPPPGLEGAYGFSSVVFVQRPHARNAGSLASPDRFQPGGRAVLLRPAAPGGELIPLTDLDAGDVDGLDVSPDGRRAVVAARTHASDRYHLVEIDLEAVQGGQGCFEPDGDLGPGCTGLTFGPADDTRPVYLPDGRIAFSRSSPDGPMDFQGRGRARVLMAVDPDGSAVTRLDFGPGHALGASMLGDGRLRAVRWTARDERPAFLPTRIDPTGSAGVEPDGRAAGSAGLPLDVVQDEVGRIFAACTPALGTWGAGTVCQRTSDGGVYQGVVPVIPEGAGCSPEGRVRDPFPLGDGRFLVSYAKIANGCMNISDGDDGLVPDFGIAVLDARSGERLTVFNDPDTDEIQVRPVRERTMLDSGVTLPDRPENGCEETGLRIEGLVGQEMLDAGAVRVRVLQGLSGASAPWAVELGGDQVGAVCAGELTAAPVHADGSFAVRAPSGVPLRLQVLDRYGAALARDPFWRGGPPCGRRRCAGCHENDGQPEGFEPPPTVDLAGPEDSQLVFDFRRDIQPILNNSCATSGCHDASTAAGVYVDLSGSMRGLDLHDEASGRTSVAYLNRLFVDRRRSDSPGRILEQRRPYVVPGSARESRLVQKLGIPCRFECDGAQDWAGWGAPEDLRHPDGSLNDEDRWLLVEWIDAGAPFHGREATP